MKCANYCGTELQRVLDSWDFYCPLCQSREAIRRRYLAQFKTPEDQARFEAGLPTLNPRQWDSTKVFEY